MEAFFVNIFEDRTQTKDGGVGLVVMGALLSRGCEIGSRCRVLPRQIIFLIKFFYLCCQVGSYFEPRMLNSNLFIRLQFTYELKLVPICVLTLLFYGGIF